ncbi:MAG TPA: YbhB/YbcL family Raf kinase inhibitor-like protein, partial [Spirochaetota bacterium]|nr:YbhB/YbcL family Raf kinase inhibitor-like protein [Spirochaetota bacterium]
MLRVSKNNLYSVLFMLLIITIPAAYSDNNQSGPNGGKNMSITITSSAFKEDEMIPALYTCDDANISPPLKWSNIPPDTVSIALIADDPDAPMGT